jgi:hypothetical protein
MNEPDSTNTFIPYSIEPDRTEKIRIRKLYNSVGIALILQYVLMMAFAMLGYILFQNYITDDVNEETGASIIGFTEAAIMFCAPALASLMMFFCYNTRHNVKSKELFRTDGLSRDFIFKAVLAAFFFHQIGMILEYAVNIILTLSNLEVPDLNYELAGDFPTAATDFLTSVILAPVAEEMFFRGVVMKQAARVSKRFGIVFSAVIFGLMHGNIYQFVMATMLGLVLGYAASESGSLVPSIICHMAVNFMASISDIAAYFDDSIDTLVYLIVSAAELVIGIIGMVWIAKSGGIKLPKYTEYHKKRTLPIMIKSIWVIIAVIIYLYDIISGIKPIQEETADAIGTAVRMFIRL